MECFLLLYLFLFIIISLTFFDYSIMQFFMGGQISQNPCYLSPHHDAVLPLVISLLKQWQHPHLHHFKTIVSLLQGKAKSNIFISMLIWPWIYKFSIRSPTMFRKLCLLYLYWRCEVNCTVYPVTFGPCFVFSLSHWPMFFIFALYTLQMVLLHLN